MKSSLNEYRWSENDVRAVRQNRRIEHAYTPRRSGDVKQITNSKPAWAEFKSLWLEHDLSGKPLRTFPDHASSRSQNWLRRTRGRAAVTGLFQCTFAPFRMSAS